MKRGIIIPLAFLTACWSSVAQESAHVARRDTTGMHIRIIDPAISFGTPVLLLPPSLTFTPGDFAETFRAEMPSRPPPFFSSTTGEQIDLLAPLKLQLTREEELSTLYTILEAVQIGGVAYIAYRHIKRYGFK